MKDNEYESKITVRNKLDDRCKEGRVISVVEGISIGKRISIIKKSCEKESPIEFNESAEFQVIGDNHNHSLRISVSPALKKLRKWTWIKLPNTGDFTFQVIQDSRSREDVKMRVSRWGIIIAIPPKHPDWYLELVFPDKKEMDNFCCLGKRTMAKKSGEPEDILLSGAGVPRDPAGNTNNPDGIVLNSADGAVTPGDPWPPKG